MIHCRQRGIRTESTARRLSFLLTIALAVGCAGAEDDLSPSIKPPKVTREPDAAVDRCEPLDFDWADEHRECVEDDDCVALAVPVTCCTSRIAGVAVADLEAREACEPEPERCGCMGSATRADDGRVSAASDGSDVEVACMAGVCASRVTQRRCGDGSCSQDELCVGYARFEAGVDISYQCVANPCTAELSCECAESVCTLHTDASRVCAVEHVEDSDVSCQLFQR